MRIYIYLFIVILIINNIHIRILTLKWQLHGVQRGSSLYKGLPNIILENHVLPPLIDCIGYRFSIYQLDLYCTIP